MNRKAISFLSSYSPFIAFTILMGLITPPAVVFICFITYARSACIFNTSAGQPVSLILKSGSFIYWLFMAVMSVFFVRILFGFHSTFILLMIFVCLVASLSKKISRHTAVAMFVNFLCVLFFFHFLPPDIDSKTFAKLNNEKYARVICSLKPFIKEKNSLLEGVRTIKTDEDETAIYFTVDHGRVKQDVSLPSLFKIPFSDPENYSTYSGDRLFDIDFTPDKKHLMATSYYESKLLIINPETLQIEKTLETSTYPQHIIVDQRGERATVLHEGLGIANVYSLSDDIKFYKKTKISGAPSKIVVDNDTRKAYAANWMYPYLLTETEMFSLRTSRKKLFLAFDGGGVSLDKKRNRVYVTRGITGDVVGVNLKTFEVEDTIKSPSFARPVYVDGKRDMIYVGSTVHPYVRVYGYDGKFLGEIFVGPNCREIVATPMTNRILVGSSLGVIELKIDLLLSSIRMKEKLKKEQNQN